MKLFIDSGNLKEIEALVPLGIIDGITTNPSLLAKEPGDFKENLKKICEMVNGPVSGEVVATDFEGMLREGRDIAAIHEHIVVKVPFGKNGVHACKVLTDEGIRVNVTLVFSAAQALDEGHAAERPAAVVKLERTSFLSELLGHAQDRRDADSAGEQDRPGGAAVEREVVARNGDFEFVTLPHLVHEDRRSAARLRLAQNADAVARRLEKVACGNLRIWRASMQELCDRSSFFCRSFGFAS